MGVRVSRKPTKDWHSLLISSVSPKSGYPQPWAQVVVATGWILVRMRGHARAEVVVRGAGAD